MAVDNNDSKLKAAVANINATPWYKSETGKDWLSFGGQALGAITNLFPQPKEYEGAKGSVTMGADALYDTTGDILGEIDPRFKAIAEAGKLGSRIAKSLGAGTDGMTTTDALLGSSFLQLTPIGLANGLMGKRANVFHNDLYTQSLSNFSYSGSNSAFSNANMKSGKKFGAFSSRGRRKANYAIEEAQRLQTLLGLIIAKRDTAREAMGGSTDIYNTGYANELMGGLTPMLAAKHGAKITRNDLSRIKRIASAVKVQNRFAIEEFKQGGEFEWDISMFQKGGKPKRKYSYEEYISIVNPKHPEWYDYKSHYSDDDVYPEWESRYEKWINDPNRKDEEFPHSTDKYKTDKHPTYSDEGYGWKRNGEDWVFYASPRQQKNWTFDLYKEYWNYAEPISKLVYGTQEYFTKPLFPLSYKQGGSLIPEGALHAHKNHLDELNPELKGEVTTKGIPVISKEGGEIVQHAEIERNEWTIRKEITDKIEKLYEKYKSEETSQKEKDELAILCGKIISKELLENTDDRTGLIEETK